jgi:GTP cyclohydrolase I
MKRKDLDNILIATNIKDALFALGENPEREGLQQTPRRVATHMSARCKYNHPKDMGNFLACLTTFTAEGQNEMIILKDIQTHSTCEHHMMPFEMAIHIGYIPNKKIVGISKLARLADYCSEGLQIQERITSAIVDGLVKLLKPKGAGCIVEGVHSCIRARGVKQQSSVMITSAMRGIFRDSIATRTEFLRLIGK